MTSLRILPQRVHTLTSPCKRCTSNAVRFDSISPFRIPRRFVTTTNNAPFLAPTFVKIPRRFVTTTNIVPFRAPTSVKIPRRFITTTNNAPFLAPASVKIPRRFVTKSGAGVSVFDRDVKRLQRNRAASLDDSEVYDYVREEVAYRLADRIYDCKRFFDVAVDLGAAKGHVAPHVFKENVGHLIQVDMSEGMLSKSAVSDEVPTTRIVADEEHPPLKPQSCDLIVSNLAMHWINDLPGFFHRAYQALRPDGALIASLFGGDTLYQLRCSLQLAEMERRGGMANHMSPFTQVSDIGSLLNRAGFRLLTVDIDDIEVGYPDMLALLHDLQGMAESAAGYASATHVHRDVLQAASAVYQAMYAKDDTFPATFQVIYLIGWRPGPDMAKPAARGSATASFKDIEKVVKEPPVV